MTVDPDVIYSPSLLFLAVKFLVLRTESKSILLMIWMVLLTSKILILSFLVSITIPTVPFDVLIRLSFLRPCTFSSQMTSPWWSSRFFLWIFMELPLSVQIYTIFGYTLKIMPVFPKSAPDITFTLWFSLNLLAKCYRGSSKISPFISLFEHFITPIFSLISKIIP